MESPNTQSNSIMKNDTLDESIQKLRKNQSMGLAVLGGLSAFLFCTAIWALISIKIEYQVGYMAIGIGLIVGLAVRYSGQGYRWKYGLVGAIFSLLSIIVGNVLMVTMYVSFNEGIPFSSLLGSLDIRVFLDIMKSLFEPVDLVFYGITLYVGFKISYRRSNYRV